MEMERNRKKMEINFMEMEKQQHQIRARQSNTVPVFIYCTPGVLGVVSTQFEDQQRSATISDDRRRSATISDDQGRGCACAGAKPGGDRRAR